MVNSIIIETKDVSMCFDVRYLKQLTFEERVSYGLGIYTQCTGTESVPTSVETSLKEAFQKVDTMETPIDTSVTIEYVGEHGGIPTEETPTDVETPIEETPTDVETPTEETSTDVEASTDTGTGEEEPIKTE